MSKEKAGGKSVQDDKRGGCISYLWTLWSLGVVARHVDSRGLVQNLDILDFDLQLHKATQKKKNTHTEREGEGHNQGEKEREREREREKKEGE